MFVKPATFGMLTGLMLGLVMSFSISFALLFINLGPVPDFLAIWLKGAMTGFAISIPISLYAQPLIVRLLNRYLKVQS